MNYRNTILATAIFAALSSPAMAVPVLNVTDGNTSVSVTDNGAGDSNPVEGVITAVLTFNGWTSTVSTGTTYPAQGSPLLPYLDLNAVATSSGAGTLTISFTNDGFLLPGPVLANADVGGTLGGGASAVFSAYVGGMTPFSTMTFSNPGAFSGAESASVSPGSVPYLMSLQAVLTHTGRGTSSWDYQLQVPEPGTLALLGLGLMGIGLGTRRRNAVSG